MARSRLMAENLQKLTNSNSALSYDFTFCYLMKRDSSLSSLDEAADVLSQSLAATQNQIYGLLRASQIHNGSALAQHKPFWPDRCHVDVFFPDSLILPINYLPDSC
jgi:hypothetical protein